MKWLILIFVIVASGCATAHQPALILPTPIAPLSLTPLPPDPPQSSAFPPPTISVAQQYQRTAQKETRAVTAANVTPAYIRAVHAADQIARRALGVLEARGPRATAEEVGVARVAVRTLGEVLDDTP
jgi:hypothetical protein